MWPTGRGGQQLTSKLSLEVTIKDSLKKKKRCRVFEPKWSEKKHANPEFSQKKKRTNFQMQTLEKVQYSSKYTLLLSTAGPRPAL